MVPERMVIFLASLAFQGLIVWLANEPSFIEVAQKRWEKDHRGRNGGWSRRESGLRCLVTHQLLSQLRGLYSAFAVVRIGLFVFLGILLVSGFFYGATVSDADPRIAVDAFLVLLGACVVFTFIPVSFAYILGLMLAKVDGEAG